MRQPVATPALRILLVDDEDAFRALLCAELRRSGHAVVDMADGEAGLAALAREAFDVVLLDLRLDGVDGLAVLAQIVEAEPHPEVVMITGHGTIDAAIDAIKLGAFDFLSKPCNLAELEVTLQKAYEHRRLTRENAALRTLADTAGAGAVLVGSSQAMAAVEALARRAAESSAPVLIQGESGTGKEVVAHLVHRASARRDEPFIPVNCGALQEQLLSSELFGHERGAFTGAAVRKHGLFEEADRGTLFLDEIGEMAPSTQVALLRALESGEIRRLGSNTSKRVDVRIISASNRDLQQAVRDGHFREDLYYRLNTLELRVPPLRARPEDIQELVEHFLARSPQGHHIEAIDAAVWQALRRYTWPGNVRELRNVVERAAVLCGGPVLSMGDLRHLGLTGTVPAPAEEDVGDLTLAEVERQHIERVLERCGGNKTQASKTLGITPKTLYNKLQSYERHAD